MTKIDSILIIGLGLIGGSLAKRIKKYHPTATLYGIAPSERTRSLAKESSLFKSVHKNITSAPKTIDCVFVCTPIALVSETILSASNHIESDCILTDVASIKESIFTTVKLNKKNHIFIPGHPMAGTEHTGFTASKEDIFTDSTYILIKTKEDNTVLKTFLKKLLVNIVETDAKTHDKMIALASHFPYIVTTLIMSLVSELSEKDKLLFKELIGPGFKDTTRVAASSPEWGYDVCQHNIKNLHSLLTSLESNIENFKGKLSPNSKALKTFFDDMQQIKKILN